MARHGSRCPACERGKGEINDSVDLAWVLSHGRGNRHVGLGGRCADRRNPARTESMFSRPRKPPGMNCCSAALSLSHTPPGAQTDRGRRHVHQVRRCPCRTGSLPALSRLCPGRRALEDPLRQGHVPDHPRADGLEEHRDLHRRRRPPAPCQRPQLRRVPSDSTAWRLTGA
ncbi:MAG: hypothetical protein MZV70_29995 [Desulfobacterales bacterium]|nr:hypothetical protein [Desulfobacterales bacterium]